MKLQWPTLSVAGASVGRPFWDACGDDDISGGFLNRCLIFDAGLGGVEYIPATREADQLEDWFVEAMHKITRGAAPDQGAIPIMDPKPGFEAMGPFRMGWGKGTFEAFLDTVSDIRKLPEGRRRDLSENSHIRDRVARIDEACPVVRRSGCLAKPLGMGLGLGKPLA